MKTVEDLFPLEVTGKAQLDIGQLIDIVGTVVPLPSQAVSIVKMAAKTFAHDEAAFVREARSRAWKDNWYQFRNAPQMSETELLKKIESCDKKIAELTPFVSRPNPDRPKRRELQITMNIRSIFEYFLKENKDKGLNNKTDKKNVVSSGLPGGRFDRSSTASTSGDINATRANKKSLIEELLDLIMSIFQL